MREGGEGRWREAGKERQRNEERESCSLILDIVGRQLADCEFGITRPRGTFGQRRGISSLDDL